MHDNSWKNADIIAIPERSGKLVAQAILQQIDQENAGPAYVSLREYGRRSIEKWYENESWEEAIIDIVDYFYRRSNHTHSIELCLTYNYQYVEEIPNADYKGLKGIEFFCQKDLSTRSSYPPTKMYADNFGFSDAHRRFYREHDLDKDEAVLAKIYDAHQFIILIEEPIKIARIYRGSPLFDISNVTFENCNKFVRNMSEWLQRNIITNEENAKEIGKMLYQYSPSNYRISRDSNLVRELQIPKILYRTARYFDDPIYHKAAEENVTYNFSRFYQENKDFGYMTKGDDVTLGAAAIGAMSILESGKDEYKNMEEKIFQFTLEMQNEDGSFSTYYIPAEGKDDQTYFPGECLLYWSKRLVTHPSKELEEKIIKGLTYYRDWYRAQKKQHPGFVSWQTQAIVHFWQATGNEEFYDFMIEINNFLASLQRWDNCEYLDAKGSFYDKEKTSILSSTSFNGIFTVGLAHALKFTLAKKDFEAATKYRSTILRSLRFCIQMHYSDDIDTFHMLRKRRAIGAVRLSETNNVVWADVVEHIMDAILYIITEFGENFFNKDFIKQHSNT